MTRTIVLAACVGLLAPSSEGVRRLATHAALPSRADVSADDLRQPVTREVYLMGTIATLTTRDADRQRGLSRLETMLEALEETEAQLSTWRKDSEVSRLNAAAGSGSFKLSPSLCRVFGEVDRWHAETNGAFDPAIGALTDAWDIHGRGRLAGPGELAQALQKSGWQYSGFDPGACTVSLRRGFAIDVGGFGKGEALDRVRRLAGAEGAAWMIDLGGQVAAGGVEAADRGWPVALAHPSRRDEAFLTCALTTGSISTSGGSERDLSVARHRVGHILDPRTGRPAVFAGSVGVWNESALAADILSTALYVMGPDEGLRWADAHHVAAIYLIPETGAVVRRASRLWTRLGMCATPSPGRRHT